MRLALLLSLSLLAGCETEEIVIADLTPPKHRPKDLGQVCLSSQDCKPEDFCDRKGCEEPAGRCEKRPNTCEIGPPVCDCSGARYPSDCIRRAAGATASAPCPP